MVYSPTKTSTTSLSNIYPDLYCGYDSLTNKLSNFIYVNSTIYLTNLNAYFVYKSQPKIFSYNSNLMPITGLYNITYKIILQTISLTNTVVLY